MRAFIMKQMAVVFLILFTLSGTSASMNGSDVENGIILKKEERLAQLNATFANLVSVAERELSIPELMVRNTSDIDPKGDERDRAVE